MISKIETVGSKNNKEEIVASDLLENDVDFVDLTQSENHNPKVLPNQSITPWLAKYIVTEKKIQTKYIVPLEIWIASSDSSSK